LSRLQRRDNPWARRNLLADRDADPGSDLLAWVGDNSADGNENASSGALSKGSKGSSKPSSPRSSAPAPAPSGTMVDPEKSGPQETSPVLIAWYATDRQRVDAVPENRRLPVWSGPVHPHLGGDDGPVDPAASWWWLGVHGGAGVSTLAGHVPGGRHAHRYWPDPAHGGPRVVVLVCRTHLTGLERARDAARQWASADVPRGLLLGGAVAVADGPGRLGRPQSEALRLLAGVVPRLWPVPWLDEWRAVAEPPGGPVPPALRRLRADLDALRTPRPSSRRESR
jgi:hypothetical protein